SARATARESAARVSADQEPNFSVPFQPESSPRVLVLLAEPEPLSWLNQITDWNAAPEETQQNYAMLIIPVPEDWPGSRMPVIEPDPNTIYTMPMIDPMPAGIAIPDITPLNQDDTHP
ncbi:MAG: hypothetical protein KJ060_20110, partial [Candidatus Hydrogenedentes bacterium]|nr:hypothetical protein [Candidatus Hydrogenedentota bacterium]